MTALNPTGVAMLLVYGARLMPPRGGRPGISVTVEVDGSCYLQPVGYPDEVTALAALDAAAQVCREAGLDVEAVGTHARQVRRRGV